MTLLIIVALAVIAARLGWMPQVVEILQLFIGLKTRNELQRLETVIENMQKPQQEEAIENEAKSVKVLDKSLKDVEVNENPSDEPKEDKEEGQVKMVKIVLPEVEKIEPVEHVESEWDKAGNKSPKKDTLIDNEANGNGSSTPTTNGAITNATPKRRKRGSRGGKKNKESKEGKKENEDEEKPQNHQLQEVPIIEPTVSVEQASPSLSTPPKQKGYINSSLSISPEVIGYGSQGTVVYKGVFENRQVVQPGRYVEYRLESCCRSS
jgi:serine/threonine-protein kinase/endoribonuclease IRE1